jgi:hypothetical protein
VQGVVADHEGEGEVEAESIPSAGAKANEITDGEVDHNCKYVGVGSSWITCCRNYVPYEVEME